MRDMVAPPQDRSTQFEAVDAQAPEQYSGSTLLVEAYAAVWLILLAWVFLLWRKQASLASRLDGLERAVARASGNKPEKAAREQPKEVAAPREREGEQTA